MIVTWPGFRVITLPAETKESDGGFEGLARLIRTHLRTGAFLNHPVNKSADVESSVT
jgi:hypothetical protein